MRQSIAIIGTGAAGLACGHFLNKSYDLTFYEQNDYVGGHANTAVIKESTETVYTDTAFIIFNDENYPLFSRLLRELDVAKISCSMGFSFRILPTGWEYNTKGLSWVPTNLRNLFDRKFLNLLKETRKFYLEATEIFREQHYHDYSIADYVTEKGYSDEFVHYYLIPIIAVVWSIPPKDMLAYPALMMIEFLKNHGAFQGIFGRKRWNTVKGGSRSYRDKVIEPFKSKIRLNCAVTKVTRQNGQAQVFDNHGQTQTFDRIILACHADQALRILGDAGELERDVLGSFRYSKNTAVLHTDHSLLPEKRSLWSGWNYLVEANDSDEISASFTYHMNKLQRVSKQRDYFVTINDTGRIDPNKILNEFQYEHPIFDLTAIRGQKKLALLNENDVTQFCGSYFKNGFHEDAFRSGIEVCRRITGEKIWED